MIIAGQISIDKAPLLVCNFASRKVCREELLGGYEHASRRSRSFVVCDVTRYEGQLVQLMKGI